jgi:hypothetical protein
LSTAADIRRFPQIPKDTPLPARFVDNTIHIKDGEERAFITEFNEKFKFPKYREFGLPLLDVKPSGFSRWNKVYFSIG